MALPRPKYFNRLYYLKAVAPKYLIQFLSPYAQFFASNGFILPASGEEQNTLDYQKLIKALMVPSINMPMDLINSLNCICEVATPECMDVLLEEAAAQGINLDIGLLDAPIDVVIQIWMHDRRIVERRHAEQFLVKRTVSLDECFEDKNGCVTSRADVIDREEYLLSAGILRRPIIDECELRMDIEQIISELTPELRELCKRLQKQTVTEISEEMGVPRHSLYPSIRKLRCIFEGAGLKDYL